MWVVSRKVWKGPVEEHPKKKGDWVCLKPKCSQQPALYLHCPVLFVRAMPSSSSLSVCPSLCSAVQNPLDHLTQWSSPYPVSHNPSMSLDHTNVDSMSSASACVCERVVLIALCMWTSLSEKTLMNCVFLCACQWPRGTVGPRNYLNGCSCISTAAGWFKGWRAG